MSKRQLKLFGSQMEIYTHLEKMFHPEAGLNTVLLTGKSGAGKSTVVQEFLREFGVSIHGYTTVRHRSVSRQEVAFHYTVFDSSKEILQVWQMIRILYRQSRRGR